jgi:quaternary ammonium compound-resistance protein SugE
MLKLSNGFTKLWPSLGFLVFAAGSFSLLSWLLKVLPVGTAYAVWTGIGAAGTAIVGMIFFKLKPLEIEFQAFGLTLHWS